MCSTRRPFIRNWRRKQPSYTQINIIMKASFGRKENEGLGKFSLKKLYVNYKEDLTKKRESEALYKLS